MPRPRGRAAPGTAPLAGDALEQAATTMDAILQNRDAMERTAALAGPAALAHWRSYQESAQAEDQDRSALGQPIPLLFLGFGGAAAGRRSLGTELVRRIIASRQETSREFRVHFPVMGVSDGQGSFSPHNRMPYNHAVAAGPSDVGMMQVAVESAESGQSLRGNGYLSTKDVVENAGQKGCVLLDVSEDKKAATKALPGLLLGGQQGYFACIVGKRSEAHAAAVDRAYPAGRLLRLSAADLEGAAPAGMAGADALQKKAAGLLRSIAEWYKERPEVQQEEAARAEAAANASRSVGRREAEHIAQQLQGSATVCPCGCTAADAQEHTAGLVTRTMANPPLALHQFQRGDAAAAMGIANLIGVAVGQGAGQPQKPDVVATYGGEALLAAAVAQLAAARRQPDYVLWRATLALLFRRGLAEELVIAAASKDVSVRDTAAMAIDGLRSFGCWQKRCRHCGRLEPPEPEEEEGEGEAAQQAAGGRHKLCKGCRPYCGRDCQVAAWPAHKQECKQLAAL
ncbi:zinc mynd-type domain containing [Micractinium conductrix]|uniref:Zinc mynd-type domain containing n=1 Tax=Micractinium conductrix TaxID=554055 RepID=A0A2P6VC63_9CHLO|nr:zinc mynd-type domain containing [Micractinium conductrix]|eukprot:PSC71676.1 zinc mynd-type domain containing [Micractinium conductrix]